FEGAFNKQLITSEDFPARLGQVARIGSHVSVVPRAVRRYLHATRDSDQSIDASKNPTCVQTSSASIVSNRVSRVSASAWLTLRRARGQETPQLEPQHKRLLTRTGAIG